MQKTNILNRTIEKSTATKILLLYMGLALVIKIIIACGLPVYALGHAFHDDALLVDWTKNILEFNWLGNYNRLTLVKGITFSLFLAFNYIFSIPFLNAQILFYWSGCVFFILVLRKNLSVLQRGILFTILFFLPITTATGTFLRIYRSNISPALVLFLFAFFIGLYLFRTEPKRKYLFYSIGCGITLALTYNLREEGIWVMPFVIAVIIITAVSLFIESNKQFTKSLIKRMALIVLPIVILFFANTTIAAINYINYGVFIRNDLAEGNFAKMLKNIFLIKPEEDIFQISVPKSTVDKLYKESPAFAELKPAFDINFGGGWDLTDGVVDWNIQDGWFMWALRDAIADTGYFDTASKMQDFCRRVSKEIELAFREGRLEKRGGGSLSALSSPWKSEYSHQLLPAVKKAILLVAGNKQCKIDIQQAVGSGRQIKIMEVITSNFALYPNKPQIKGWLISYDDNAKVEAAVFENSNEKARLYRNGGEDIYHYFSNQGYALENAHNSRFDSTFPEWNDNLTMIITVDGIEKERIPLDGNLNHGGNSDTGYEWHIDSFSPTGGGDIIQKTSAPRVKILNKIAGLYSRFGQVLFLAGVALYIFLTIQFVFSFCKKNLPKALFESWLILTGIICSALVLITCIAYMEISAYNAINSMYLSPAYPLITAFEMLSIFFFAKLFLVKKKKTS
ncbi:MAG: hypothetical protein Ta2F_16560 [Termitinemataceae bacterium]|nr:MAG: hypothetical protein Ta2F_16560 [Termitinemataceae bacterium]